VPRLGRVSSGGLITSCMGRRRLTTHERAAHKISRVTFYAGLKPLLGIFGAAGADEIYGALNSYLAAFVSGARSIKANGVITKPIVFRASMLLFKEASQRVKDKYGKAYTQSNFAEILSPLFDSLKPATLKTPVSSHKELHEELSNGLKTSFFL